jgi:hypothetical protein
MKVNSKGLAPIYIGFYLERRKVEVPTKISISPDYFDTTKSMFTGIKKSPDRSRGIYNQKRNGTTVQLKKLF